MKKYLFLIIASLFSCGCSSSLIKLSGKIDNTEVYPMFGKVPAREFFTDFTGRDSLQLKWEAETNGSFMESSVSIFGDYVFVNDLSGRVYCFDIRTGKTAGQLKHKGPVYTTPVINRYNLIYIEDVPDEDNSYFRVYNFLEGRQVAADEFRGRVKTELLMLDKNIYFVTEKGILYKFSNIGDQYWFKELNCWVHSSPVSDGSRIYILADDGKLTAASSDDGKINLSINTGIMNPSGLSLYMGNILAGDKDGNLYSISSEKGAVNWKLSTGSRITATPVIEENRVYSVNLAGKIICADVTSGKEIWHRDTGGLLNSTPLIAGNLMIIPDLANRIIFTDKNTGELKKILALPNRAKLSPVIKGNLMFIGLDRGIIRAYEFM